MIERGEEGDERDIPLLRARRSLCHLKQLIHHLSRFVSSSCCCVVIIIVIV